MCSSDLFPCHDKQTGKSVKHWFITELGHEKTERLHLHGIVWGLGNGKKETDNWKYGITFTGYFVNEKTINYITKYMLKIDEKHPKFRGKVLCSAGIGAGYLKREDAKRHVYIPRLSLPPTDQDSSNQLT